MEATFDILLVPMSPVVAVVNDGQVGEHKIAFCLCGARVFAEKDVVFVPQHTVDWHRVRIG